MATDKEDFVETLAAEFLRGHEINLFQAFTDSSRETHSELQSVKQTISAQNLEMELNKTRWNNMRDINAQLSNLAAAKEDLKKEILHKNKQCNVVTTEKTIIWEASLEKDEMLRRHVQQWELLMPQLAQFLDVDKDLPIIKELVSETKLLFNKNLHIMKQINQLKLESEETASDTGNTPSLSTSTSTAAAVATTGAKEIKNETLSQEESFEPAVLPLAMSTTSGEVNGIKQRLVQTDKKCAPQNGDNSYRKITTTKSKEGVKSGTNGAVVAAAYTSVTSDIRNISADARARYKSLPVSDNKQKQKRDLGRNVRLRENITKGSNLK